MDDKKTVEQAIAEVDASIVITEYVRSELGEGIEKRRRFCSRSCKTNGK